MTQTGWRLESNRVFLRFLGDLKDSFPTSHRRRIMKTHFLRTGEIPWILSAGDFCSVGFSTDSPAPHTCLPLYPLSCFFLLWSTGQVDKGLVVIWDLDLVPLPRCCPPFLHKIFYILRISCMRAASFLPITPPFQHFLLPPLPLRSMTSFIVIICMCTHKCTHTYSTESI